MSTSLTSSCQPSGGRTDNALLAWQSRSSRRVDRDGQARIRHLRLLWSLRDERVPVGGGCIRGAYSSGARGRAAWVPLLLLYRASEFSRLLRDRPYCLPDRLGESDQRPPVRTDDLPVAL